MAPLQVLLDKPRLPLVGAYHIADKEVMGAVVAERASTPRRRPHAAENALVGVDQFFKRQG